jgi:hypothetical protein
MLYPFFFEKALLLLGKNPAPVLVPEVFVLASYIGASEGFGQLFILFRHNWPTHRSIMTLRTARESVVRPVYGCKMFGSGPGRKVNVFARRHIIRRDVQCLDHILDHVTGDDFAAQGIALQ